MRLHALLDALQPKPDLSSIPNLDVLGVQEDSRLVRSGDLFIARPGTKTDGRQFVEQARERGAIAVVTSRSIEGVGMPQVIVSDPARAGSLLAHALHGDPTRALAVVGVTGTNGKTTTTYLLRHLLNSVGKRCGMVGTVEIDDGRNVRAAEMTTPGAVQLAELFASMRDHAFDACAIETSSHALHQQRVAGVRYAGAGFTNLTGDHLDYHGTMERYADAKAMLFEMLDEDAVACVNADSPFADRMVRDCRAKVVRFSMQSRADWTARDIRTTSLGTNFILHSPDGLAEVSMKLVGRHNVENTLCAASLVGERFGLTVHQIAAAMKTASGAPGRLQPVDAGQRFAVLVDYAHTDDALENVLRALRPITTGKLRVVFGCGGDRDRTKRPRMAKVAERLADVVYVTSDNPRTEDPLRIIEDIRGGFSTTGGKTLLIEPDRRAAIATALSDAETGDCVLIAGKGHENYQIVGTTRHHFDDVEEANRVLRGIAVR